ncbi:MAG: hypothetical protein NTY11_01185 [Candidatus Parcubacteria bacterium]|nr:hypothetical protein [Candidatus Parcubacteria bacterium]
MIKVVIINGTNPEIFKLSGNSTNDTNQTIAIFITNPIKPKVNSRIGNKKKFKIGLMK